MINLGRLSECDATLDVSQRSFRECYGTEETQKSKAILAQYRDLYNSKGLNEYRECI